MAKLKLYWSEIAIKQRNHTFEYWNSKNKSSAYTRRLLPLIKERTTTLITFPEMGKTVDFENTRVISLEHFSIFYEIIDDKIIVISFWDNRRNPKELLTMLKKNN